MNNPSRVIGFVNAGHFIDHYSMLIFAAAVIIMGPALGMAYSELLPYATPGFVAFGAGSLVTGWLGDRWSRRHMMVIFFFGIGASMIAVGFVQTPLQLGAALLSIGIFASIYHPVGTAMIVSYANKLGREMGLNGVFGNLGVASSALVTGVIGQYLGWRFAFIIPGIVTMMVGVAFMRLVVKIREHFRGYIRTIREPHIGVQNHPRDLHFPVRTLFHVAYRSVVIGFDRQLLQRADREEGEHMARRQRRNERFFRIDAIGIAFISGGRRCGERDAAVLEHHLMRAVVRGVGKIRARALPANAGMMFRHVRLL